MRGIADRWLDEGTQVPTSHFAMLTSRLDFSHLDTRFPFALFLPQLRTEQLLEEHLASLGVPYLREHAVTGLRQDAEGVDVDVMTPSGPDVLRAAYVAGCDGGASTVREAAGIGFLGTPATWSTIMGDVELTDPPPGRALTLNLPGGSILVLALGGGRYRLVTVDHATLYDRTEEPVTIGDLRASAQRLAGTDYGLRETPDAWLSRVSNATSQAASYRAGRVLLAGDAAHIHYPAGGQGLNLGLQDATNLAWKLAATLRGWAPGWLLDSARSAWRSWKTLSHSARCWRTRAGRAWRCGTGSTGCWRRTHHSTVNSPSGCPGSGSATRTVAAACPTSRCAVHPAVHQRPVSSACWPAHDLCCSASAARVAAGNPPPPGRPWPPATPAGSRQSRRPLPRTGKTGQASASC
jgi:2-polyprenyl-6-methoxyphenol hydroxylase-like FAD-dependent oxidoreductase